MAGHAHPQPQDPRPANPASAHRHPLSPTSFSPLGFGGHLAPNSETLPRFEIQVACDQTLRRQDHLAAVRAELGHGPQLPAVAWGVGMGSFPPWVS